MLDCLIGIKNVDIYHSATNSLADRKFDSTTKVKVIGVSCDHGYVHEPRLSDPAEMLRSNIWRGYNCILVRHDPIYDYQCLFDPDNDFKKKPKNLGNQFQYSLLKYKLPKGKKSSHGTDEIYVFCNAKYVEKEKKVICMEEVSKNKSLIDMKNVLNWYAIEALFAPNTFKSSRINSLHDQVYNQSSASS